MLHRAYFLSQITIFTSFIASIDSYKLQSLPKRGKTTLESSSAVKLSSAVEFTDVGTSIPRLDQFYHHEFWRKERTHEEVKYHVSNCLSKIDADTDLKATVHVVSAEPPLVVIHNFLSDDMCNSIIQTAKDTNQLKLSTTGNQQSSSNSRTSSTVWLNDDNCQAASRHIAEKVASISGLPPCYMENLQVVRYQVGQEFKVHTDHQDSFNDLDVRGRLATCLMYLNEPTEGGSTWFPGVLEGKSNNHKNARNNNDNERLISNDIKVEPTKGSAVFFWNTIEKPGCDGYTPDIFLNVDTRMRHAGLAVDSGEKWVCNRWIHPVNFGAGVRGI